MNTQPSLSTARNEDWEPPPIDFVKLNWDAAVNRVHYKVGIGIAARDNEGNILATLRKRQDLFPNPLLAKTFAALQSATLGSELGLRKIILEGDSKKVVMAIQGHMEGLNCFGMLVTDIRIKLQCYEHCSIIHIPREAN